MKNKALVLDLDDTLYAEIDFLKSAYLYISERLSPQNSQILFERLLYLYQSGENVFDILVAEYPNISKEELLELYRFHQPNIKPYDGVLETIREIRNSYKIAIVTDGRSITQRNKIKALGLEEYLEYIVISEEIGSEKPSTANYKLVEKQLKCDKYFYVGDNLRKDFVTPNRLGWKTICLLDKGQNIHQQDRDLDMAYQPHYFIKDWYEIIHLLK